MIRSISALIVATVVTAAHPQAPLNNDTVVQLVRSGVPEGTVIKVIDSQKGSYKTGPDDVAELQQAGVSGTVIAAMASQQGDSVASKAGGERVVLDDGVPIRLRLARTLNSGTSTTGDTIDFDVLDDVRLGDRIVVPHGTKAIGTITVAEHRKRMGRGGKLDFTLDYLRLGDGTKVMLRAQQNLAGNGHVGAMTAAIVGTALFVAPIAAPFFLMMHGKDVSVPEGTELTAYVNGEVGVNPSNLLAAR